MASAAAPAKGTVFVPATTSVRAPAQKRKRSADDSASKESVEWGDLEYMRGFGNEHSSEALKGALPVGQNTPQRAPYGLYSEQLTGTAFTVPRKGNQRSWLYRIVPSVRMQGFAAYEQELIHDFTNLKYDPSQFRWGAIPHVASDKSVNFVDGLIVVAGQGEPGSGGICIYNYACNASMGDSAFNNSDGDFLIVPQEGPLRITTEFGKLYVTPREICVIQRGCRFTIDVEGASRGYVLEVFARHFILPDLGPIGANGLANARDFEFPVAWYEDRECDYRVYNKFGGKMFSCKRDRSVYDVVAWHGNYVPYKYNLDNFNCMNSVTYDHPDPSIYTVLTCPSDSPGTAIADFVIFPPRWMVMEKSFRPPYYHRNVMSEYMGMIYGSYDAKVGFVPGGSSLHNATTPHGPDADTFYGASSADLKPERFDGGLAFMFETCLTLKLSKWALEAPHMEKDYIQCWQKLPILFDPSTREVSAEKIKAAKAAEGAAASASASS